MNSLGIWTLVIILYQTVLCVIISWLTLDCKLSPSSSELSEVTLIKLLYLYEPETCERTYFYNYSVKISTNTYISTAIWPVKNTVAESFRFKIQIWLTLHVLWFLLALANLTQNRPCGFYVALLPFTCTGLIMLVVDVVHTVIFIRDLSKTSTEEQIFDYITTGDGYMGFVTKTYRWHVTSFHATKLPEDTSWIAVLMAYASCRGVVQWIINFWIVKDNYFEGLAAYRRLQSDKSSKRRKKSY
ncbi:unnamed protein product [Parnassius mnemosyne]|uniref:Uncharacterized protein n=1 Tax=Parnassius mnemosyne TaxID=213953 RepID=A0AAV1KUA9_9NEOP